jgi:hypothetical protein
MFMRVVPTLPGPDALRYDLISCTANLKYDAHYC